MTVYCSSRVVPNDCAPGSSLYKERSVAYAKAQGFRLGTRVKIRGRVRGWARIENFYDDIFGGVRLDKELWGFYSWNVDDLEPT